jgi:hypothetical protein
MGQVDYGVEEKSVTADHFGGYVSQKVDIMKDQQGFIVPDIISSLSRDLAERENAIFVALLATTTNEPVTAASNTDISLTELHKGVVEIEAVNGDCLYILMHPRTVATFADEMIQADLVGDNSFLRRNAVGQLFGATVVKTTRVPANVVYYLGNEAVKMFERMPYTLTNGRDSVKSLEVHFAVEARFGFGFDRDEMVQKSTFTGN